MDELRPLDLAGSKRRTVCHNAVETLSDSVKVGLVADIVTWLGANGGTIEEGVLEKAVPGDESASSPTSEGLRQTYQAVESTYS